MVFLVTGAASGIGRHLVHMLISRGESVVATDINELAFELGAERLLTLRHDVTLSQDWERVVREGVSRFGRIDVALNVAGYLKPGWAHEMAATEVHRHFDVNVKGVIFGTQTVSRQMITQGSGHIINIASLAALMPIKGLALYSASKYAVRSFSLAVAQELAPHNVAVSVICPDAVRTPMLDLQKTYPQAAVTFSGSRILTVDDIAKVIFNEVLPHRPLEVFIPRWRGWLGRFGDLFPRLSFAARPLLDAIGRRHQRRYNE